MNIYGCDCVGPHAYDCSGWDGMPQVGMPVRDIVRNKRGFIEDILYDGQYTHITVLFRGEHDEWRTQYVQESSWDTRLVED